MLIDRYIQQWAGLILKESGEKDSDTIQSRIEETVSFNMVLTVLKDFLAIVSPSRSFMKFEYDIFDVEFDGMPMITNNEDGTYSPTEQCKKIFLDLMNDAAHIDHVFFPPENRFGGVDDIGYKLDKSLIGQLRNKIIIRNGRHGDIGMYDVEIKPGVYKMLADSVSFGGIKNAPFKITIKLRSGYLDIISSHKDISNMRQNMKKTSKPNLPNESKEELNE